MPIPKERLYENAVDQEYCGWICPYPFTAARFDNLARENYRDAGAHAENCRRLARGDYSDAALEHLYCSAVELQLDGFYSLAATKFYKLAKTDYKNSVRHLEECRSAMADTGEALEDDRLETASSDTEYYLEVYKQQSLPEEPQPETAPTPEPEPQPQSSSVAGWMRAAFLAAAAACFAFGALAGVLLAGLH